MRIPYAFPCTIPTAREGMTLLDYFAGQVLSSVCTDPTLTTKDDALVAKRSYELATAMLLERERLSEQQPE